MEGGREEKNGDRGSGWTPTLSVPSQAGFSHPSLVGVCPPITTPTPHTVITDAVAASLQCSFLWPHGVLARPHHSSQAFLSTAWEGRWSSPPHPDSHFSLWGPWMEKQPQVNESPWKPLILELRKETCPSMASQGGWCVERSAGLQLASPMGYAFPAAVCVLIDKKVGKLR